MSELNILDVGFSPDKKGVKLLKRAVETLLNSDHVKAHLKKIPPNVEKLYELMDENIKNNVLIDKLIQAVIYKASVYYLASFKTGDFTEEAAEKLKAYKTVTFWKMDTGQIVKAKRGRKPSGVLATFKKRANEL